ncbi:hypothetical protein RR42_s1222 [Cupriavidus basilensis]|uniref:Uncharacterized protein n=1 Tax=Cupriavidus basilensis TaxID=68895 RepID=A0A0C4YJM2_9BURK|nr:hypothetical protein RR42_s1222 [Cupriavidus basilensis]
MAPSTIVLAAPAHAQAGPAVRKGMHDMSRSVQNRISSLVLIP